MLVFLKDWLTTRIHLDLSNDAIDVETSERENLRELAILKLCLQEEDLALASANMAISGHNVTPLIDHKASLVNIDILSALVLTQEQLDVAPAVAIKDSHYLLKLKGLAIVVVELGHEATELAELLPVKPLDSIFVYNAALLVN
jgi:hypothetical protein